MHALTGSNGFDSHDFTLPCYERKEGEKIANNNFAIVSHTWMLELEVKRILKQGDFSRLSSRRQDSFLLRKIDDNNIDNEDEFFSPLISLFNFLYWMYAAFY